MTSSAAGAERPPIFSDPGEGTELSVPPRPLKDILSEGLITAGIPAASLESMEDPRLSARIVATIAPVLYEEAERFLGRWAPTEGLEILGVSRTEPEGRVEYVWQLRSADGQEGEILFVCPRPAPSEAVPEETASRPEPKAPEKPAEPGRVALIIDDMGSSLEVLNELLNLGEPITVAILPFSTFARETAEIAHSRNLEILLHLPLESQNDHDDPYGTEGMIFAGMDDGEIVRILSDDLDQVPFIRGVNNHMGSRLTTEPSAMRTILGVLKQRGLFFVDSRTTAQTVAYDEALRMGVPATKRDVFLDADEDRAMIRSRLLELFRVARNRGRAVGICHPFPETLRVLREDFHLLGEYGLEAVPVSELLTGRD